MEPSSSTSTGARRLRVKRQQPAAAPSGSKAAEASSVSPSEEMGRNQFSGLGDPLVEEVLLDLLGSDATGEGDDVAVEEDEEVVEEQPLLGAEDADGVLGTTMESGNKRIRPNAKFLSRLMTSTSSLNTRIIQESEGLLPAAGPESVFTQSFIARRRRGIALANRIAQKYGLRMLLLPANPHNADPSDRKTEQHACSCPTCGSQFHISTQVSRGIGMGVSGSNGSDPDNHMPTRVTSSGPLPLQVNCQFTPGTKEAQAATATASTASPLPSSTVPTPASTPSTSLATAATTEEQQWKLKESSASSGAWATDKTASHTPAPGDLLPPPPTPPPLAAVMSGVVLLPSSQIQALSASDIPPSPAKPRIKAAAPSAPGVSVATAKKLSQRSGRDALGGALAMLKRSLQGSSGSMKVPDNGSSGSRKRPTPTAAAASSTKVADKEDSSDPLGAAAPAGAEGNNGKRRRVAARGSTFGRGSGMARMLQGVLQGAGRGRGRGGAGKKPLVTAVRRAVKKDSDFIPGSGEC